MLANRTDTIFVRKQTIVSLVSLSLASTPVHPDHLCTPNLHNFAFLPFSKRKNYNQIPDILVSLYKYYCNCISISGNFSLGQRLLVKKIPLCYSDCLSVTGTLSTFLFFSIFFFFGGADMKTQKINTYKDWKLFIAL